MGIFWNVWIVGLTLINLALLLWVLLANRKVAVSDEDDLENKTTGHVYDGIEEYDNPLPKWWFQMFLGTFIFSAFYLLAYPGLGSYKGFLGWTSTNQLERQQSKALVNYESSYGVYSKMSIEDLALEPRAMKMASRIFSNNCAVCHGADGGGALGFPNLTDNDWLYGGSPDQIHETLVNGRQAAMPGWSAILGEKGINQVTQYVLSLSGTEHDAALVEVGKEIYSTNCVACHGADGKGNYNVGAPNLTDDIWLYEGTPAGIRQTLRNGRNGVMPAQKERLREDKIHLLTAYIYQLSLESE